MPIDPDSVPDRLHWYEGMLLAPEHFRTLSRRHEALSGYLNHVAAPYAWGVRQLKFLLDESALEITEIEAVMPDGLLVRYDKSRDADLPLKIELKDVKPDLESKKRQTVHLIVPAWSEHLLGQDGPEAGGLTRYRSVRGPRLETDDVEEVAELAADAAFERPWLRPALALQVTDEPLKLPVAKYVSIPLLTLFQSAESIVADKYEPPRTRSGDAPELLKCARKVIAELRARARFLNERLQRDAGLPTREKTAEQPTIEMQLRLLARSFQTLHNNVENLQSLARSVPRLEALVRDGNTHPFTLYLALCDVVGDVALLGGDVNLPDVPAYAHADPLIAYEFLTQHILWMLDTLKQRFRVIPFERVSSGRFELRFRPLELGKSFVIGAVRERGTPASQIASWMAKAAIATDDLLPDLKRRRVSGARRDSIDRDETLDLTPPVMTNLFKVQVNSETIRVEDGLLVVENTTGEGPRDIMLYAAREPDEADAARIGP